MQDFAQSSSVQREKQKILVRPHPVIIRRSLHNPIATASADAVCLQRCLLSASRPSSFPWSSDIPFQNPASHKWLGCMLSTENAGRRQDDIDHRLQSAARAFHVHKWILCDKMVSMASRLKFFDAMITSVVCFAAGHRKLYTTDL